MRLRGCAVRNCAVLQVGQRAVDDVHAPRRTLGDRFVVGDDDEREAFVVELLEQVDDRSGRLRIEIPRRFVAQQQARRSEQRSRDGDALALATRELDG